MKYQGASTESRQKSIEDTLYSETEIMEEETDETMSLGMRDSRWSFLMPSNFSNEVKFVLRSITWVVSLRGCDQRQAKRDSWPWGMKTIELHRLQSPQIFDAL